MKKNTIILLTMHLLFCMMLIYWFYNNSMLRPGAVTHMYKEVVSAMILLLIIYTNYLILLPKIFYSNYHLRYWFVSLLLVGLSGLAELWLVESDISLCVKNALSEEFYRKYIHSVLFLITLRNGGFYLFFTMLGQYRYTRKKTLKEKKEIIKKEKIAAFLTCNGKPIVLNINNIIYFQQNRNRTTIYTTSGKVYQIYSSLSVQEDFFSDICLKINRNTLVNYANIVSYSYDYLLVKDNKHGKTKSLYFFKNTPNSVFALLQEKLPHLEQKNDEITPQNDDFGGINYQKEDKKTKNGRINAIILETIYNHNGISVEQLAEILQNDISLRTLERNLKDLRDCNKIEYRGSKKIGGYFFRV